MAKLNIADIRQEYTKGGLRENELPGDPLSLFSRWLQEAIDAEVDEPTAVIVGTVSPEGRPSTRTVLLKGLHDGKFVFYTNYESRKGRQLAQNPYISLSFVWHALERQIHIEGIATKVPPGESDEYFRKRPYKSRVGARISPQSQPIISRMQLIRSFVRRQPGGSEKKWRDLIIGVDMPLPLQGLNSGKDAPTVCMTVFYILCNRTENGKSVVLLLDFVDFSWQLQLEYVILQL